MSPSIIYKFLTYAYLGDSMRFIDYLVEGAEDWSPSSHRTDHSHLKSLFFFLCNRMELEFDGKHRIELLKDAIVVDDNYRIEVRTSLPSDEHAMLLHPYDPELSLIVLITQERGTSIPSAHFVVKDLPEPTGRAYDDEMAEKSPFWHAIQ